MNNTTPCHFSNKLELHYNKRHSFLTDRIGLKRILPGIIFGSFLCLLGLYEGLNIFQRGAEELVPSDVPAAYTPLFPAFFFELCFFIVGFGMIISNIVLSLRYNKYKFSGNSITIIKRPLFRDKIIIKEDLRNYIGVRFRAEFLQSGFLPRNLYVIELFHKNPERVIPLYLSTSEKDVRRKWKEYAKTFKLPGLINTEKGIKSIELKNLNKSISTQYRSGLIKDTYDAYEKLPPAICFVRKNDKMVLKIRKIVWDAYNFLGWALIALLAIFVIAAWSHLDICQGISKTVFYTITFICLLLIVTAIQILFRKEKLVIKKHKIVNTHKYMLFSTKHNEIMKKDIEAIEITENPATGRFFVSIISENNIITFGSKMPIKDLQWIKKFLIHEIVTS